MELIEIKMRVAESINERFCRGEGREEVGDFLADGLKVEQKRRRNRCGFWWGFCAWNAILA